MYIYVCVKQVPVRMEAWVYNITRKGRLEQGTLMETTKYTLTYWFVCRTIGICSITALLSFLGPGKAE